MKNSEKEISKNNLKKFQKRIRKIISEFLKKQIIKDFQKGIPQYVVVWK